MNKRNLFTIGGAAAFGLALVALAASPARAQKPEDSTVTRLQQKEKRQTVDRRMTTRIPPFTVRK